MFKTKNLILIALGSILGAVIVGISFYLGSKNIIQIGNNQPSIVPQPTTTPAEQAGTIEGSLGYPSEGIPEEMEVCAETTQGSLVTCTGEHISNSKYTYGLGYKLEVQPGTYHVYATIPGFGDDYKAYYNEYVECGLSVECESHEPIEVEVSAGETVVGVDPQDWYNR